MSIAYYNGAYVIGNFNKVTKKKPKDWIRTGYKIIVPYRFRWREKIGKVECDCQHCEEHFLPYYGVEWYHLDNCALMQYIRKRPQVLNLWQHQRDMRKIASVE
jgi:hypothetical protein